jgi:hypothetical protein
MANRKSGGNAPQQPGAVPAPASRNYPVVATPEKVDTRERKSQWMQGGFLASVCALVIGVYACTAHSGYVVSTSLNAADDYYNLLVQGFRAGQLNLKKEVPPGLAQLADPTIRQPTSVSGARHELLQGEVVPVFRGDARAVLLFWPYVALTGHYLQKDAVVIFAWSVSWPACGCCGHSGGATLLKSTLRWWPPPRLHSAWPHARRSCWRDVMCTRCPISCGYALTMLALAAIWKALHESRKRSVPMAGGGQPGLRAGGGGAALLLFGAVVLLVPVVQAWRERGRYWLRCWRRSARLW